MERLYLIYKITNKINGKIYIGQTHFRRDDYFGSGKLIKAAIEKYGIENFEKEYIDEAANQEELDEKEKYWIKETNCQDKNIGYNIADGGWNDFTMNEEIKQKISKTLKGKYVGENAFIRRRVWTQEIRDKVSNALKGRIITEEQKKRMRAGNLKRQQNPTEKMLESRKKSGERLAEWNKAQKENNPEEWNEREERRRNSITGHIVSEETKKLLSELNLNRHQKHSYYVLLKNIETNEEILCQNKSQAARMMNVTVSGLHVNQVGNGYIVMKIWKD